MTTESDGATPNPGDPQQPNTTDAAAIAAQAQPQATTADEPAVVDIDAQEVANAKAAAEAEKAATPGDDNNQAQPVEGQAQTQPQGQTQQPAQGQPQGQPAGDPVLIPKGRFDEVAGQRDRAAQEAAYWRGVAEARGQVQPAQTQQQGQPQPQGPTAEQRLTEIGNQIDALAKKFDDGEITMADFKKQERTLASSEQAIREEVLAAKLRPQQQQNQPQPAQQDDALYLDSLTAQLEQSHPWVEVFDKVGTEVDWKYVRDTATENLLSKGVDPGKGNIGTYNLRVEMARLIDELGPTLIAPKARAKGIATPGQGQQQRQNGNPPLSREAQARANKLNLAASAPPNLNAMNGNAGDVTGVPSDSRLEGMSDDEIGAMPDSSRRRLLGLS